VEMHWVEYKFKASEAYDLLRNARNEDDCRCDFLGWFNLGLVENPSATFLDPEVWFRS
jgi:hypothetical protein